MRIRQHRYFSIIVLVGSAGLTLGLAAQIGSAFTDCPAPSPSYPTNVPPPCSNNSACTSIQFLKLKNDLQCTEAPAYKVEYYTSSDAATSWQKCIQTSGPHQCTESLQVCMKAKGYLDDQCKMFCGDYVIKYCKAN